MPTSVPLTTKNPGDVLTSALWNAQLKQNIDKLLNTGHRTLTVAQFAALTGLEGTKGVVAGDEVYLEVDATNGILWHLVYESTETTYKWRYLGGPALFVIVAAAETTQATAYGALATAGPAIPVPRAGDFDIEFGARITSPSGDNGSPVQCFMSFDIGGTGAVDGDAVTGEASWITAAPPAGPGSVCRSQRKTGLTAVTLTAKYRKSANTTPTNATFQQRWMKVTPTRLI